MPLIVPLRHSSKITNRSTHHKINQLNSDGHMLFNKNPVDAYSAKHILKSIVGCNGSAVNIGCDYYIMHCPSGYVKGY